MTRQRVPLVRCSILATLLALSCSSRDETPPISSRDDWNARFHKMASSVKAGMTKAQVTEAIGKPDLQEQIQYEDIREVWKYTLEPDVRFQVNFNADGIVVGQQLDAPKFIWV